MVASCSVWGQTGSDDVGSAAIAYADSDKTSSCAAPSMIPRASHGVRSDGRHGSSAQRMGSIHVSPMLASVFAIRVAVCPRWSTRGSRSSGTAVPSRPTTRPRDSSGPSVLRAFSSSEDAPSRRPCPSPSGPKMSANRCPPSWLSHVEQMMSSTSACSRGSSDRRHRRRGPSGCDSARNASVTVACFILRDHVRHASTASSADLCDGCPVR